MLPIPIFIAIVVILLAGFGMGYYTAKHSK